MIGAMVKTDPVARVVAEHEAMRAAEAERARRKVTRAEAIRQAQAEGSTIKAIAEALDVTTERVYQMLKSG